MTLADALQTPGTHSLLIPGVVGVLEVELNVPVGANRHHIALLAHPHSLQGGTMHNKVVTTMARAFNEARIPCVRFNCRGVGASAGVYDEGVGESEDMLLLAQSCLQSYPKAKLLFAGFSFGSYVAYRAAAQCPHELLLTIAPPVHHFDYTEFSSAPKPWVVFQGDNDDVVPVSLVLDFVAKKPELSLVVFPETSHFFHGKLIQLKQEVFFVIQTQVLECKP
jgi:uncharacterized protein